MVVVLDPLATCPRCQRLVPPPRVRGLCKPCYRHCLKRELLDAYPRLPNARVPDRLTTPVGVTRADKSGYVRIMAEDGWTYQHRWVMEQHIQRRLAPGETVHHINGDRSDNRIENLELWYSPQPYGQRVEQLIEYALEFHLEAIRERLAR